MVRCSLDTSVAATELGMKQLLLSRLKDIRSVYELVYYIISILFIQFIHLSIILISNHNRQEA